MPRKKCGLTLIELLISVILMSLILLGFFSIDLFSRNHVVTSDRRAKVQNEISYALEHMSKYVQQANGNGSNPAIVSTGSGFQVNVDFNSTQTPSNLLDDGLVSYSLSGNTLSVSCSGVCGTFLSENLSNKIIAGVAGSAIMPESPTNGFYVNITDQGTAVDIGLAGRYDPAVAADLDNPQISMKTRLVCPSSSAQ